MLAVEEFVDASAGSVYTIVVVAFSVVGPVAEIDATCRAVFEFHASKPGRVDLQEIWFVFGDVAAAFAFDTFDVHAAAVGVAHERLAPVFLREVLAVVQHQAAVTVA